MKELGTLALMMIDELIVSFTKLCAKALHITDSVDL